MKRLVLAGAGHAHAGVLRAWAEQGAPAAELVLLTPTLAVPSSGMLPGYLAGHYGWQDCLIDFASLARRAGARWLQGSLAGLDPHTRLLRLHDGSQLSYDLLSLNLGPAMAPPPAASMRLLPLRPLDQLAPQWQALCDTVQALPAGGVYRLMVVGAGAAGVECVLAAAHRLRQLAPHVRLQYSLALAGQQPLRDSAPGARRRLLAQLDACGVTLLPSFAVVKLAAGQVHAADGRCQGADAVLWATAAQAPPALAHSGLQTDNAGFVQVDQYLRSLSHPEVYAVGDCASFPQALAKAGVYAVRMGPVLADNLRAALNGAAPRPYRPQRRFLTLMGTGPAHAVASWGKLAWEGAWVWRWKRRIDQRFLARHR